MMLNQMGVHDIHQRERTTEDLRSRNQVNRNAELFAWCTFEMVSFRRCDDASDESCFILFGHAIYCTTGIREECASLCQVAYNVVIIIPRIPHGV